MPELDPLETVSDRQSIIEAIQTFDRPGPRYTSYPTAIEFGSTVDHTVYESCLAEADALGDEPLSLYLHLPFCQHRCYFCGCHVIITPHTERALPYLDLLAKEIELVAERLPRRRRFAQLHLGGGTPTYFQPAELKKLLGFLLDRFTPTDDAELAIEVDPRVTTTEHLETLAELGFNRISLGVQDLDHDVQEAVNRVQSLEQVESIVRTAKSLGFRGINVDLIYGLPKQRPESFEATLEKLLELPIDRAAVYSFAFLPGNRHNQRGIIEEDLPDPQTKVELFALARERFLAAGWQAIGMDHFARADDELSKALAEQRLRRNFQGYTVIPADDVIGMGISAIGDIRGCYVQNEKKLSLYKDLVEAGRLPAQRGVRRSREDEIRRELIHDLMCNFRVDKQAIGERWELDFDAHFATELERLTEATEQGLVTVDSASIEATPMGRLFVRNLAMCFDEYYWSRHEGSGKQTFSRTI